jgi:hypothetical protein
MLMTYAAEVVRGWPYDGCLDLNEPIAAGVTVSNGDWVVKKSDGTIDKIFNVIGTSATVGLVAVGLVVQGNGDSPTTTVNGLTVGNSAQNANVPYHSVSTGAASVSTNGRAVVMWGNYIADLQVSTTVAATFTPGQAFTFKANTIAPATGTDPVIGYVTAVVNTSGSSTTNESTRIRVKAA